MTRMALPDLTNDSIRDAFKKMIEDEANRIVQHSVASFYENSILRWIQQRRDPFCPRDPQEDDNA